MHLVEVFLPMAHDKGFARTLHDKVREELTAKFGGVTAFTRAPARGAFEDEGSVVHDDIAVYEVMIEELDRVWWAGYRRTLERLFRQDEIVIRASTIERI